MVKSDSTDVSTRQKQITIQPTDHRNQNSSCK